MDLKKLQGSIRSNESWLKPYAQKKDFPRWQKYLDEIQKLLSDNAGLAKTPEGQQYFEEKNKFLDEQRSIIINEQAMTKITDAIKPVDSAKRWLDGSLTKNQSKNISNYRTKFIAALDTAKPTLVGTEVGDKYLADIEVYLLEVDKAYESAVLFETADAAVRKCNSNMSWCKTYLKQNNTAKASEYFKKLEADAGVIVNDPKYHHLENVKKFLESYAPIAASMGVSIESKQNENEVKDACKPIESMARWLKTHLDRKDLNSISKSRQDLQPAYEELVKKFSGEPLAKKTIDEVSALFERCDKEVQPIIDEQAAKSLANTLNSAVKWLSTSLNRKDLPSCMKYRPQVEEGITKLGPLLHVPIAKSSIADAESIIVKVESEMGGIIAQQEIKPLVRSLISDTNWCESGVKNKDVKKAQLYGKKLEDHVFNIKSRYEKAHTELYNNEAKQYCDKAQSVLTRLDSELGAIIAEAEATKLASKLKSALSFFEGAMRSKNVDSIIKRRQNLVAAIAPLKSSQYRAHPVAKDTFVAAEKALDSDKEINDMIATAEISKVSSRCRTLISLIECAAKRKDTRAGLVSLQGLHSLAQPLRSQFPSFPLAVELFKEIDEVTARLGPQLGNAADEKEIAKYMGQLMPLLEQAEKEMASNGVAAVRLLKQTAPIARPLRKRFGFNDQVQQILVRLDSVSLALTGCVGEEDEGAPDIEIDWKLDVKEQDALKIIKTGFDSINVKLNEASTLFSDVCTDGSETFSCRARDFESRLSQDAMKSLETAQMGITQLEAIRPDTEKDPNANLRLAKEALPRLKLLISEKLAFYVTQVNYALCNAAAVHALETVTSIRNRASTMKGSSSDKPWQWLQAYEAVKKVYDCLHKAEQVMPECHDESDMLRSQAEMLELEAETSFKSTTVEVYIHYMENDQEHSTSNLVNNLKEVFPDAEELKIMEEEAKKIKAQIAERKHKEEVERKAKEAEKERKREEERAVWRNKFVIPYTGGSVKIGNSTYGYVLKDNKGTISEGKHNFTYYATTDGCIVNAKDPNQGYAGWNGSKLTIDSSAPRYGITWCSYEMQNGNVFVNCHDKINKFTFSEANGTMKFEGKDDSDVGVCQKEVKVQGSVPPLVVIYLIIMNALGTKIMKWREPRIEYDRLYQIENDRRNEIWRDSNKTCQGCNTSGSNIKWCYSCGTMTCTKCQSDYTTCPICSAWCDNYCHVSSDWERKTQEKLGF